MKKKAGMDMTFRSFKYYLKEGLSSINVNRLMTFASLGAVFVSLLIWGAFLIFSFNINSAVDKIARDCELQIFIDENVDFERYKQIGEEIKKIDNVLSVEMVTKDKILEDYRKKLKDEASALDGLEEDNPFRNSFKIKVTDLSLTQSVAEKLNKINGVAKITDFREAVDIIVRVSDTVEKVSVWIVLILWIISAFIISNTVKVAVFARRKEIGIMKYIGAKDWFIRWPFVIEGVIIGVMGAIISLIVILLGYWRVVATWSVSAVTLMPVHVVAPHLSWMFLVCGIVIGAFGSAISLRKYLKV